MSKIQHYLYTLPNLKTVSSQLILRQHVFRVIQHFSRIFNVLVASELIRKALCIAVGDIEGKEQSIIYLHLSSLAKKKRDL